MTDNNDDIRITELEGLTGRRTMFFIMALLLTSLGFCLYWGTKNDIIEKKYKALYSRKLKRAEERGRLETLKEGAELGFAHYIGEELYWKTNIYQVLNEAYEAQREAREIMILSTKSLKLVSNYGELIERLYRKDLADRNGIQISILKHPQLPDKLKRMRIISPEVVAPPFNKDMPDLPLRPIEPLNIPSDKSFEKYPKSKKAGDGLEIKQDKKGIKFKWKLKEREENDR